MVQDMVKLVEFHADGDLLVVVHRHLARIELDQLQLVQGESISHFLDDVFLDLEDDRVLDEILRREVMPGVTLGSVVGDREEFRASLIAQQREHSPPPDYSEIPVSPQRRRQQARKRLAERTQSVAARVLSDLSLSGGGRELSKAAGRAHQPNRQTATALMHARVNSYIGIDAGKRGEISGDQAIAALEHLDVLGDEVVSEYRPLVEGV